MRNLFRIFRRRRVPPVTAGSLLVANLRLWESVNEKLDKPATANELLAALESIFISSVIAQKIRNDRGQPFEEDYHGE
jgi:hypothetical protein